MKVACNRLPDLAGCDLGWSDWLTIDQALINGFAQATGDHQWIHVDVERSASHGGTIAHGFLTLALIPQMAAGLLEISGAARLLNCGVNRVRFPAAVRSGARIRVHQVIEAVSPRAGGFEVISNFTVVSDRDEKPVCVAQSVILAIRQ